MLDFRLQVFYTVAKRLNFTKAAADLFISQPAVTRHIKELEQALEISLFERSGNRRVSLTPAGETVLAYAEQIFGLYRELEYDISLLSKQRKGVLKIGASSTVAQYVIPPVLAQFHKKFKDIKVQLITGNTADVEKALLNKEIALGIIEGVSRQSQLKYEHYLQDELVLVSSSKNLTVKKETITATELKDYPLLLREPGSGTLEVIAHFLKAHQLSLADLNIEMQLGSTESIKSYVLHSKCLAFLSVHAILKELKNNECRIIDIKNLTVERPFQFITAQGQQNSLAELFMRFARKYTEQV